jgi:hypothetical protein
MSTPRTGGHTDSQASREGASLSEPREASAALDYARAVHMEARESNQDLMRRAQIVLSLDGIVIVAVGAALAGKTDELRKTVAVFAASTWVILGVAAAALMGSVLASAMTLFSRRRQGPSATSGARADEPATMWYYNAIAKLDRARFIERAEQADALFEIRARLTPVTIMAPIMVRRARWLNCAFACTALAFVAFAIGAADS